MTTDNTPAPAPDELKALEAKRRELAAARAKLEDEAAAKQELEAAKRALRDEEALTRFTFEHGPIGRKIAVVETDLGLVIVQRPNALKFRRFQDKGSYSTQDISQLVRPCVLWPEADELDALLDELPASLARIASAVVTLAGHRNEDVAKK